jgi:hypothetical protein
MQLLKAISEIADGNSAERMLAVLDHLDAFVGVHRHLVGIQSRKAEDRDAMFKLPGGDKPAARDAGVGPKPSARTWTSGKYTVTATFVGFAGDKVQLRKSDGNVVTVPISILSETDQSYLKRLQ